MQVLAERAAWEWLMAEGGDMEMRVVNPVHTPEVSHHPPAFLTTYQNLAISCFGTPVGRAGRTALLSATLQCRASASCAACTHVLSFLA